MPCSSHSRYPLRHSVFDGGTLQCGAQNPGTAEDIACNILTNWWPTFTLEASSTPVLGGADVEVLITTPMSEAVLVDLFGIMDGKTIEARAVVRQEIPALGLPGPGC